MRLRDHLEEGLVLLARIARLSRQPNVLERLPSAISTPALLRELERADVRQA